MSDERPKDPEPERHLRRARLDEAEQIQQLMRASIAALFPAFYDELQTASAVTYVGEVDRALVEDGTYFVIEEEGYLVACGGWSRRDKLYTGSGVGAADARLLNPATEPARVRAMFVRPNRTRRGLGTWILEACEEAALAEGFRRVALMATLPGLQLYEHFGFEPGEWSEVRMPDGVTLTCVAMAKPLAVLEGNPPSRRRPP